MKELSIGEKAKRYDEVVAMAKECITYVPDDTVNKYMLNMFPELKESGGEKIKNFLIDFIKVCNWTEKKDQCWPLREECIAWLEKQGQEDSQVKLPTFTFDDILALQCCMETVKKVQEDRDLYNELLLLHNKVYDAYTITKR